MGGGRSTGGGGSPFAGLKSVSPPAFGKGPRGNIPASSGADELDGISWLFGRSYAIAGSGSFSQSDGKALCPVLIPSARAASCSVANV